MAATRRAAGLSAAALPRRQFVAASLSQPFSGPCRAGQRRHRTQVFPPETNTDEPGLRTVTHSASNGLTAVTDPASQNLSTQQQMHPYGEWIDDATPHNPAGGNPSAVAEAIGNADAAQAAAIDQSGSTAAKPASGQSAGFQPVAAFIASTAKGRLGVPGWPAPWRRWRPAATPAPWSGWRLVERRWHPGSATGRRRSW